MREDHRSASEIEYRRRSAVKGSEGRSPSGTLDWFSVLPIRSEARCGSLSSHPSCIHVRQSCWRPSEPRSSSLEIMVSEDTSRGSRAAASLFDQSMAVDGQPSLLELFDNERFDSELTAEISDRTSRLQKLASWTAATVDAAMSEDRECLTSSRQSVELHPRRLDQLTQALQLHTTLGAIRTEVQGSVSDLMR